MNRTIKVLAVIAAGITVATVALSVWAVLRYRPTLEYAYVDPSAYWFMLALVALLAAGAALVVLRFRRSPNGGQMK